MRRTVLLVATVLFAIALTGCDALKPASDTATPTSTSKDKQVTTAESHPSTYQPNYAAPVAPGQAGGSGGSGSSSGSANPPGGSALENANPVRFSDRALIDVVKILCVSERGLAGQMSLRINSDKQQSAVIASAFKVTAGVIDRGSQRIVALNPAKAKKGARHRYLLKRAAAADLLRKAASAIEHRQLGTARTLQHQSVLVYNQGRALARTAGVSGC